MKIIQIPDLPEYPEMSAITTMLHKTYGNKKIVGKREFCDFILYYEGYMDHYYNHSKYRLEMMHKNYKWFRENISEDANLGPTLFGYGGKDVDWIHWEFESFLMAVNSTLDVIARICGPYYPPMSFTFNKLCKVTDTIGPHITLRKAKDEWAQRMKDYRDCFVHYIPIMPMCMAGLNELSSDSLEVSINIPDNPESRSITKFVFNDKLDMLKYSVQTFNNLCILDNSIANELTSLFLRDEYPKRYERLFSGD